MLDHSPLFSSAKLKMVIVAAKVIWVSSDDKTGESEVGANSNSLLTCLVLLSLLRYWILAGVIGSCF